MSEIEERLKPENIPDFNIQEMLSDPMEIREWNYAGLPADALSRPFNSSCFLIKCFPKKKRLARAPRIELTSSSVEGWVIVLRQKSGTLCFSPSF